jgi:hypothetical protein
VAPVANGSTVAEDQSPSPYVGDASVGMKRML